MTSKSKKLRQNNRQKNRSKYLKQAKKDGYLVTASGQVEHREVWKTHFGPIPRGWDVHHIDFDKSNNDIENLIALPHQFHNKIHYQMARGRPLYTREELWLSYLYLR